MSSNYYEHYPTVALEKPLLLTGFPGIEYREVSRDLAALTGLPFIAVDHWVEHQAGQSLRALVESQGAAAFHQAQTSMLHKALGSRPCGSIAAGDGVLIEPANLARALEQSVVICLRLSLAAAYWELRRRLREHGSLSQPFLPCPLDSSEQLRPRFAARREGYQSAHMTIDMEYRSTDDAVRLLMESLPRLGGSEVGAPAEKR